MTNPLLLWFVGYSNITSIVIITLCFLAMTVFIGLVSMNGDYTGQSRLPLGVEQRNMVKVTNPFFLQLEHQSKKLADGLRLRLSSLSPSKIFVLWGAKINAFHDLLLKPGHRIRQAFSTNKEEYYQELDSLHSDSMEFLSPGDHIISLPCPATVSSRSLGDMPRKRYPVAVFVFVPENIYDHENVPNLNGTMLEDDKDLPLDDCNDESNEPFETDDSNDSNNTIIGLVSVAHLRDEIVSQSSHIIGQYIKTSGIPLYSLQPLYMSSGANSQDSEPNQDLPNPSNSNSDGAQCSDGNNAHRNETVSESVAQETLLGEKHTCTSENRGGDVRRRVTQKSSHDVRETNGAGLNSHQNSSGNSRTEGRDKKANTTGDNSNARDATSSRSDDYFQSAATHPECVVCQTRRAKCALLPCRHTCVCLGCFRLLDRCPLCRGPLESYFILNNTDESDDGEDEGTESDVLEGMQHEAVNANFVQMWERFNDRLNGILGFR